MSWKGEILSEGEWVQNMRAYATEPEAKAEVEHLQMVFMLVEDIRTVTSDQPVNYRWEDGHAIRLDKPAIV